MKRFIVVGAVHDTQHGTTYPVWQEFAEGELARHYNNHPAAVSLEAEAAVGEFVCVNSDFVFRHADGEEEDYFHDR